MHLYLNVISKFTDHKPVLFCIPLARLTCLPPNLSMHLVYLVYSFFTGWCLCLVSASENITSHDNHRGCERLSGQREQVQRAAEEIFVFCFICRPEQVRHVMEYSGLQRPGFNVHHRQTCVSDFSDCSQTNKGFSNDNAQISGSLF